MRIGSAMGFYRPVSINILFESKLYDHWFHQCAQLLFVFSHRYNFLWAWRWISVLEKKKRRKRFVALNSILVWGSTCGSDCSSGCRCWFRSPTAGSLSLLIPEVVLHAALIHRTLRRSLCTSLWVHQQLRISNIEEHRYMIHWFVPPLILIHANIL